MFCNRQASFCNRLPVKKTNHPNAINRLKVNVDGGHVILIVRLKNVCFVQHWFCDNFFRVQCKHKASIWAHRKGSSGIWYWPIFFPSDTDIQTKIIFSRHQHWELSAWHWTPHFTLTLDTLTDKSTPDIMQYFESTPDTPLPFHGPFYWDQCIRQWDCNYNALNTTKVLWSTGYV